MSAELRVKRLAIAEAAVEFIADRYDPADDMAELVEEVRAMFFPGLSDPLADAIFDRLERAAEKEPDHAVPVEEEIETEPPAP